MLGTCLMPACSGHYRHASSGRDYHKEVENDAIEEICSKLSAFTVKDPAVVNMIKANGLEELVVSVHNVRDTASAMLCKWLQLEDEAMLTVVEDDDGSEESVDHIQESCTALVA